jgi:hypothetical protein
MMDRVSAMACGYKNAIDLDLLRHDPLMKLTVGRCPEGAGVAINRLPAGDFAEQNPRRGS